VKELKQERRLVKEQNQSVINKGGLVKPLVVKAVEQPKSPAEKVQERKQRGTSAAPGETPRVKSEEKVASPSRATETKESKGRRQSSPEPEVKQPESAREKVQERRQPPLEKSKSGAAVETPKAKPPATVEKPVKLEDRQRKGASESKPESRLEPRDRKAVEVKEKSAGPIKAPGTIESRGGKQVGPDQKVKPVAGPAKVPEARGEIKGGKQTVAEKKESQEEMKATKELLEGKGKSEETKAEKIEIR